MGSAIVNGKLCHNVTFVDTREEADVEVLYDRIKYENDCLLYTRAEHLVATKKTEPFVMLSID